MLNISYLPVSGIMESALGLFSSDTVSALSNLNSEYNAYVAINLQNEDIVSTSSNGWNNRIIALGNGVMTHYEFRAAVGQPTTASATVEFLNALLQPSGTGQPLPSIGKQSGNAITGLYTLPQASNTITQYADINPANISLSFDTGGAFGALLSGQNSCPIDSFAFSIDVPRTEVKDLGWAFPNTRSVLWPVTVGIRAEGYLNTFQLDSLNRYQCADSGYTFVVQSRDPCVGDEPLKFTFQGAKLDSQSISAKIGGSHRVSFNWSLKIYDFARSGGPNLFISPRSRFVYTSVIFPQVDYVSGLAPLTINLGTGCYLDITNGAAILLGNSVYTTDDPGSTAVVRATVSGSSEYQDITMLVGS
jgi:hypothetical protein